MPTKYELQAELRELNRGFPRMAISKMKMHELEAAIDGVKKMKTGALESLATKTPATGGRPSSRPIVVEDQEDDDVTIRVPKPPAERKTEKRSEKKKPVADEATMMFPGVMRRAKEAADKKKVVKGESHTCNCVHCTH